MIWFSIVIPLFNKRSEIEKALYSIKFQTYQNFEVIIINDGSDDGSQDVVAKWIKLNATESKTQYRLINQKNSGVSAARNNGIKESKYDYIALLDADDLWIDDHLLALKVLIEGYSEEVDLFSTSVIQLQNNKRIYPRLGRYEDFTGVVDFFKVSLISNGFIHPSSVCIKSKAIKGDLFPKQMKNYEDVITWAKLSGNKGFGFCSNRSAVYVIDNAEASIHVDFNSYIQFDEILNSVEYDGKALYKIKFFLLHLLFCRMSMPLWCYLQAGKGFFGKNSTLFLLFLVVMLVPRFLLKALKDVRKLHRSK